MCKYVKSIHNLAEEDQPGYKLVMKGKNALSDAETLCLIIGSGTCTDTSLDIAQKILKDVNNNLALVARMSTGDLQQITGIGRAKASAICASFELGRRRSLLEALSMDKITRSTDAYEIFKSVMQDIPYEEFWVLLLNKANKVLAKVKISEGGISGTVVDPKKIFKIALDHHASSIIIGHNHPSGNIQPSEPDHKITHKIKDAGMMLDMAVLDHIIVGDGRYYSFADDGTL